MFRRLVGAARGKRLAAALAALVLLGAAWFAAGMLVGALTAPPGRGLTVVLVLLVVTGLLALLTVRLTAPRIAGRLVLEIDLQRGLAEQLPDHPLAKVALGRRPLLWELVETLGWAAGDRRVVGLVARLGGESLGLAQAQELRDAIHSFRDSGKPAFAFAETFGEGGPGNASYYLAAAFEQVYLQPSGDLGLTGLIYEQPFLRGVLDRLGITPRLDHRQEYKTAMYLLTERQYTEPHRESITQVMESQFDQMLSGIARDRGLEEDELRRLVDDGPLLGREALEAGLVDHLGYRDQVYRQVRERAGTEEVLYLSKYRQRARRAHRKGRTVALVHGVGAVRRGRSGFDPRLGGPTMGSDTVTAALRSAIDDPKVEAILFRVDSPGGSYVASDAIWRETLRAREAGKPVVVWMGNLAGSGGYFVAMAADHIIAEPATLTGSIGVVGGKLVTTGLWERVGLAWDEVHAGDHATMWSSQRDYSPGEWTRLQASLDRIYDDFIDKVAQGRELAREWVLEIAKGRVWSGEDALQLGLVDELGGMEAALRAAREAAAIPEREPVRLRPYPPRKPPWKRMMERPESSEEEGVWEGTWRSLAPAFELLGGLTGGEQRVLSMW
ncbi:MAG: signal peptide peptidase SppA [Actinomycetota bacterium]|nr:signal peptide peptidase SppA [Actinomycetota bacterium]